MRCNEAVTELRASLVGAANYGDGSGFIHMCITACAASEPAFSAVAIVEFEHDRLAAAQREPDVRERIRRTRVGTIVRLLVQRDGSRRELVVTLRDLV